MLARIRTSAEASAQSDWHPGPPTRRGSPTQLVYHHGRDPRAVALGCVNCFLYSASGTSLRIRTGNLVDSSDYPWIRRLVLCFTSSLGLEVLFVLLATPCTQTKCRNFDFLFEEMLPKENNKHLGFSTQVSVLLLCALTCGEYKE